MIGPPTNTRIWLAAGFTDMRSGFDGLAAKVQLALTADPSVVISSSFVASVVI